MECLPFPLYFYNSGPTTQVGPPLFGLLHRLCSGGSRQVSVVSTDTPFEIVCTEFSNLNTLIEHSDWDSLLEQYTSRYSITVVFIRNNVWESKVSKVVREKKGIVKVDDLFFALNLRLRSTYTLQQNRNLLSKSWICHCYAYNTEPFLFSCS